MCRPKQKPRIVFVVRNVSESNRVVTKTPQFYNWPLLGDVLMSLQLTSSQQCDLSFKPLDKKGNPAKVDGVPVWQTDNTEVLALTPAADGLSCSVAAVGPLGTARVSVVADADLGEGVIDIVGVLDCEVTAGQAVTIKIEAGAITEQP